MLFLFFAIDSSYAVTKVMITAFEPFLGRAQNGSELIAAKLKTSAENPAKEGIEYHTCILPVEYDRAAEKAKECYEKIKPHMVLSMGESGCELRLETQAHNLDNVPWVADAAGVLRSQQVIRTGAKQNELLTLPLPHMICVADVELGSPVLPSLSPGYYVCNNTAYHLGVYFKERRIPYGFLHVPEASCGADSKANAQKVHKMMRAAEEALRLAPTIYAEQGGVFDATYANPECEKNLQRNEELSQQLSVLKGLPLAACQQSVNNHRLRLLRQQDPQTGALGGGSSAKSSVDSPGGPSENFEE